MRIETQDHWQRSVVAGLPKRWQKRVLNRHERAARDFNPSVLGAENEAGRAANIALREIVGRLESVKLSLNASDLEVCQAAEKMALWCLDVARVNGQSLEALREAMAEFCRGRGVEPPGEKIKDRGAIARMTCRDWWRRQLRALLRKAVEGAAIELGYVNRAQDCYVSNESLARRQQQNKRNAMALENTVLRNELDQEYTLAELAARGTGNKAIRRGELMTRIAGFERIAKDCGHDGLFLTITCPSRMHKFSIVPGTKRVIENPKYDGTNPREAQAYLCKVWQLMRSHLARHKIGVYGFRIAEPNHDGTPHWHLILFVEPLRFWDLCETVKGYALRDSPDEAGAERHRVEMVRIDGSAAGYVAKYVAKNIDGLHVENDLFGNPALETALRVEAWAATWGIRQFQSVGGAPVTVWRELRRVKEVPEDAPEALRRAHAACNRVELKPEPVGEYEPESEGAKIKAAAWDEYIKAQGGPLVGRNYAIRLEKEEVEGLTRYGEEKAAKPFAVSCMGIVKCMVGLFEGSKLVNWLVRSVRHVWEVVRGGVKSAGGWSRPVFTRAGEIQPAVAGEVNGWPSFGVLGPLAAPWTCVNNCTQGGGEDVGKIGRIAPGAGRIAPGSDVWEGAEGGIGAFSYG